MTCFNTALHTALLAIGGITSTLILRFPCLLQDCRPAHHCLQRGLYLLIASTFDRDSEMLPGDFQMQAIGGGGRIDFVVVEAPSRAPAPQTRT